ncbi:AMP-binding protein [Streptomyces sp. NPDC089424]|uniref:AMP-binding protein n=1 Tax=Streptomyces sp. NPDC089424 TaxID=3365917 RepID=UPI003803789C
MDSAPFDANYTVKVWERLRAAGSRDAVVDGSRRISGTEAADMILRFAGALRETGLEEGDGVALFAKNSAEALLLAPAVHYAGFRLVFVPPEPGDSELEELVRRADVKALLFDPVFDERVRKITDRTGIPQILGIGASSVAPDFLGIASAHTDHSPGDAADGRHIATLLYTGGTTGHPKLVTHRSRFYTALSRNPEDWFHNSADPKLLISTLVTHSSGHISGLLGLLTSHTIVLLRDFDAGDVLSTMQTERVTAMMTVTPMLYELLDHPSCVSGRCPALSTLYYTGASAAPARLHQAMERFGRVLYQIYGATETGLVSMLTAAEHDLALPGLLTSCGRPAAGVETELRDEKGDPIPVGEPGELYVRSRTVMEGYWEDAENTAEVLNDEGWFRSGDLARQDARGYLYIVDRVRDVIVTGRAASNVYSRLLDDFLVSLPEIRDAATIGLPDDDGKECVHVVMVPEDPARLPDLDELTRRITERLGPLYTPVSYTFTGALPLTAVGKTDKKALRAALLTTERKSCPQSL